MDGDEILLGMSVLKNWSSASAVTASRCANRRARADMAITAEQISASVQHALAEDIGSGDITAALIPEQTLAQATVISRETAILSVARSSVSRGNE